MAYSGVYVFGDSLVDAGNALELAETYDYFPFASLPNGAPTAGKGYFDGRFTNGYTFADLISNKYLGVATKPVFPFGYDDPFLGISFGFFSDPSGKNLNFAYGGAQIRQGDEAVPDLDDQTDAYRDAVDGDAGSNALHIFSFGANDVHDLVPKHGTWASLSTAQKVLQNAANEMIEELRQTIEIGARHLTVIGVPDIGIQPYYNGLADEAQRRAIATQYAEMLDGMIQAQLGKLQTSGVTLHYIEFGDMQDNVIGTMTKLYPYSEIYPLNHSNEVFFDLVHPTAQVHALAAGYLIDELNGTFAGERMPLTAPDYSAGGNIALRGEVDTLTVSLAANTSYTFQLLGLSSLGGNSTMLADPRLVVVGPSGIPVGSNDDGGLGLDASFTFNSGSAGDYVIQLSGVGRMTGSYRFTADGAALGNDTYIVSHSSALILERAAEGYDTVKASVSYALQSGVSIERLATNLESGTASINLTGNEIVQSLVGNSGANVLDSKGGSDAMWGLAGADKFQFSTALGAGNTDQIYDYNVRDDTIWLDDAVFKGLALGALATGAFAKGAAAAQADDRIIYDPATGKLLFDQDGSGAAAPISFATVSKALDMTAADFFVG